MNSAVTHVHEYVCHITFQCIAKNALKNEVEEEIYIPDTIDVNAKANVSKSSGCC